MGKRKILIVDDSDHGRAGSWFAACLDGDVGVEIRARDNAPISADGYAGVIITGSERSVFENVDWIDRQITLLREMATTGAPLLGVCFGHQLIFRALYGKDALARRREPEVGWVPVTLRPDALFAGVAPVIYPFNFHFDEVAVAGGDWEILAYSDGCAVHAVRHRELPWYGLQFHPEITPVEGAAGIKGRKDELASYGRDAGTIVTRSGKKGYYPEIVNNFVSAALRSYAATK